MDDEAEKKEDVAEDIEFVPDEEGIPQELAGKIKKLREGLKSCEAERKEYLEGWQRAKADFINFKKDEGKRFEDMARFVTASIVEEFLPVLDSFDLALAHGVPESVEKGIMLIRSQFEDVLRKRGIEEITVGAGDPFDPAKHEWNIRREQSRMLYRRDTCSASA
ncbi:MAG: Protein GrpE [Parcubacteria group bacterium GW2011_GWB1_50_9]|nr:MAG: Protein GrpE [Parcubacteria group bacterium GW2011_GWB1_50_9]